MINNLLSWIPGFQIRSRFFPLAFPNPRLNSSCLKKMPQISQILTADHADDSDGSSKVRSQREHASDALDFSLWPYPIRGIRVIRG